TSITDPSDPVLLGSVFTYTVNVENVGPDTATDILVTDTLPSGVTYLSNDAGCSETSGVLTCGLEDISSGATHLINIAVTASQTGTFTNTAMVTTSALDPNPVNNTATETTTITLDSADLAVTLTDSVDPVNPGNTITYAITVTNNGPDSAHNVTLEDVIPEGVIYLSNDSGCAEANGTVTCTLGDLASGASVTVRVTVTADQPGTWSNQVTVSSETADPISANNTASEDTTILEGEPPIYFIYFPIVGNNE
ncbi:MAG TPA: DUF11 domain-containing protein, partial [Anaerolineales bacterium]|nr:DUF11 domain-containing protein [Anaerolineales bacterium]